MGLLAAVSKIEKGKAIIRNARDTSMEQEKKKDKRPFMGKINFNHPRGPYLNGQTWPLFLSRYWIDSENNDGEETFLINE